jgi:lysophospholipase L1-like esterase
MLASWCKNTPNELPANHADGPITSDLIRKIRAIRGQIRMSSMRVTFILLLALVSSGFAEDFKLTLLNPGMESGRDVPDGWRGRFGKVLIKRDTETFHSGTASLSVQNTGAASGSGHQMLAVKPGLKLRLEAWIKSAGPKASFAAQFFDDKFTWNEFIQVRHLEGEEDWQLAQKEFTVPERATRMAIALYVDGVGRAWLDEVTLSAENATVEVQEAAPDPERPKEPDDPKLVPTTAVAGYFPDYPKAWKAFHDANVARAKQGGVDVLFLGDSITQGWSTTGKEAWEKNFAPLNATSFGIGGDKTGNLLWRIEHGEVDGLSPKLVVLMIGVNNVWSGKNTAAEIAGGIRAVVEKLRARLPQTRVLLLGILPFGGPGDLGRNKVQEINSHAAALDDGTTVKFVDLGPALLQKDGKLLGEAYMADNLHLTAKGYETLAKELVPPVADMIK